MLEYFPKNNNLKDMINKFYNKGKSNQIHVVNNVSLELPKNELIVFTGISMDFYGNFLWFFVFSSSLSLLHSAGKYAIL